MNIQADPQQIRFAVISLRCPGEELEVRYFTSFDCNGGPNRRCEISEIGIAVKIVTADCCVVLEIILAEPGHCFHKNRPAIADVRATHGSSMGHQSLRQRLKSLAGEGTDGNGRGIWMLFPKPDKILCHLVRSQKVAFV